MNNLQIEIVSDVSCPWCIIGYKGLQLALEQMQESMSASIQWLPFELNPHMPPAGQELIEHLTAKYNISEAQCEENKRVINQRGLEVGYKFGIRGGGRIFNTFDAHRLLHWAHVNGKQMELKLALFDLYFKDAGNPSDHEQLLSVVEQVGLSVDEARSILISDRYSDEVRHLQRDIHQKRISSVPAMIINQKYLISGGQSVKSYVQALTEIAKQS